MHFKGLEYFTVAGPEDKPQLAELDTSLVAKDKRKYPIEFPKSWTVRRQYLKLKSPLILP